MTSYRDGGFFNHAYHDNETLEIDRRKTQHTNPYDREYSGWWGERDVTSEAPSDDASELASSNHDASELASSYHDAPELASSYHDAPELASSYHDASELASSNHDASELASSNHDASELASQGDWQYESWRGRENIPMDIVSTRSSLQHESNHSTVQIDSDPQNDRPPPVPRLPSLSGNMTVRLRGMTIRRMSMFPDADPANVSLTEDAIRNEVENEEQNLIKELVALSTTDRIQAIRDLPRSFEEKKLIRSQVDASKSSKKSRHLTYIADVSENVSLSLRRCVYGVRSARQTMELWHGVMKEIGGKFGTSVLSYFVFLKWLLMFNIFSFLVNFSFITIPMLIYPTPNKTSCVDSNGLEILTGAGYFGCTVMYYGAYTDGTLQGAVEYNIQLAYFFTIAVYMVLCGIALIYSMASSFRENYVLADPASNRAWQLLCSWDFSVINEKAVRQRRNNLRVQLKESLSEKNQREQLTVTEKLKHFGIHLGSWLLSTGLAVGCAAAIYFLYEYEKERAKDQNKWQEAVTLLVPFMVSLMNLVIPLFYSFFNKFEHYGSQRGQIYALVVRNVLLRLFILAVLCYYWMHGVVDLAQPAECWENLVGQALYRLVIFDFLFLMLGTFFGEFLRNLIGTRFLPQLGVPEFDVARNVLDLIYAQTLAWIGIYFSPLLPAIQILKFFILFYVKKVSLTMNCQPPRRSTRAAQMQTIFIFLLFFPFFVGALSIVAYTSWRLTPSKERGPFKGLSNTFSVVGIWISELEVIHESHSAAWIYHHVIRSEIFYFLITGIILVIIYIFWQVIQGRKELIVLLRQQIVNEGKDKSFLLDKLQNLQKFQPAKQKKLIEHKKPPSDISFGGPSKSNGMIQALLARQQLEEEEASRNTDGVPVPADISTSSAVMQAMLARQRAERENQDLYQVSEENSSYTSTPAQAMRTSSEIQERDEYHSTGGFHENRSSGFAQAMQARQRAEDSDGDMDDLPTPMSSVMMQVMEARKRAEEEVDSMPWVSAPSHNPASSGSSALIQAMLARQQAQNEYDDGY